MSLTVFFRQSCCVAASSMQPRAVRATADAGRCTAAGLHAARQQAGCMIHSVADARRFRRRGD
jgi:hypothetical protein